MVILYLAIALVVGYLIGNINFARIFSWAFARKDITTVGSKNPGTMNMLRTRGFGEAFLTLIMEAIKAGVPALACYFIFGEFFPGYENLAYFLSAFGGIFGHCFPVFYKFKGGKGVACTFGMFVFHPQLWWVSLIVFVICFLLFFFIDYPFVISLTFILTMTIYSTCLFAIEHIILYIAVLCILWLNFALIVILHRGNIVRLATGKENKVHFKDKVFKRKGKKLEGQEDVEVLDENGVEEKEIVVDDKTQTQQDETDKTDKREEK